MIYDSFTYQSLNGVIPGTSGAISHGYLVICCFLLHDRSWHARCDQSRLAERFLTEINLQAREKKEKKEEIQPTPISPRPAIASGEQQPGAVQSAWTG